MMASLCIEFIDYPKFQEYILETLKRGGDIQYIFEMKSDMSHAHPKFQKYILINLEFA